MASRRNFFKLSALGILAGGLQRGMARAGSPAALAKGAKRNGYTKEDGLKLGIAGYTFAKFDIPQSIEIMQRVGITRLSVKDFHLPLDSTPDEVRKVHEQFNSAGIDIYAVGVIYMKTREDVDRAFKHAKSVGVNMIVGVPGYELLGYTEESVKVYDIKIAIHNHGPEDKLYPGPKDVYDRIRDLDPRVGICLDIGHARRAGADPAVSAEQYADRIFDLHIKDVSRADKDGKAVEAGRGIIDFPGFVQALHDIDYQGICSIEFEKDMDDPLAGIAESVGFFKGVDRALLSC